MGGQPAAFGQNFAANLQTMGRRAQVEDQSVKPGSAEGDLQSLAKPQSGCCGERAGTDAQPAPACKWTDVLKGQPENRPAVAQQCALALLQLQDLRLLVFSQLPMYPTGKPLSFTETP